MHFAFKFPNPIQVIDRKQGFGAGSAKILKLLPIVTLSAGGAFEVQQIHTILIRKTGTQERLTKLKRESNFDEQHFLFSYFPNSSETCGPMNWVTAPPFDANGEHLLLS